ncbi:pitp-1 [Pristionchus pacificus]|nr:pitp-1 [Pristionchus pacificus]
MLIKEYRILLPLTVEEYKIAQLYMIQKKSRIDSHGAGAGVEIITNKPYNEGPGGSGQYTFKIYHIAEKIPGWIRAVIPTANLEAHEEAWNAYPVTKTRYSTPLMDRVSIEVDTLYFNDDGNQDNVFNLSPNELRQRQVDIMDFVKDPVSSSDYCAEEDPKLFRSVVTGRGPLNDDWVEECIAAKRPIMCAYKLCKVEFRYWGLQTRVERWIHELALRNTMTRAHRQAWAWQDEWCGLTIGDIRKLEDEVALHLSTVMANNIQADGPSEESDDASSDDLYFDCMDGSPEQSSKPSIIRWSSELLLDNDSPPSTPFSKRQAALLVLVFHGDFNPEGPADTKTTDTNTFRSTIDQLILKHYPQLVDRVHVSLVSCAHELAPVVAKLAALNNTFGSTHPALGMLLSANRIAYSEAVENAIKKANEVYDNFLHTQPSFAGEVFLVGDTLGGLILYEVLSYRPSLVPHLQLTRHSSSVSSNSPSAHNSCRQSIPEGMEEVISPSPQQQWQPLYGKGSGHFFDSGPPGTPGSLNGHSQTPPATHHHRNSSAPPSASFDRKKRHSISNMSQTGTIAGENGPLNFQPTCCFLLGCPLGIVLMHQRLGGCDIEPVENCQMFNLYYPLDLCGARIEPVLNPQLCILPPSSVPRYQRSPLGDGKSIAFDPSLDTNSLWGSKRIDHTLYCPSTMVSLPSAALPNILHASYWESWDVAAFLLRQFVRGEEGLLSSSSSALSPSSPHAPPLTLPLPQLHWKKRRTRFKITNLSANHRANDSLVVQGNEQIIHARFCYGPMDLVALTREAVNVYLCPARKEWFLHSSTETDSHGRLTVNLGRTLPCGIHSIKMIVQGDHSYLDAFIAVVPNETPIVVFSIDGSLTASVSVTGRDPRVRPGAVDVARFWHEQGFLLLYVTARPDMQQRGVAAWLAQHNFPHAMLYFAPSFLMDPLKQKTCYLRQLQSEGMRIHAAYGSNKDVAVYASAGVDTDRIATVGGRRKHTNCVIVDSYSAHLAELVDGSCPLLQNPRQRENNNENSLGHTLSIRHRPAQRSSSFTPRNGKLDHQDSKK